MEGESKEDAALATAEQDLAALAASQAGNGADAPEKRDPYVEKIEWLVALFDPKAGEVSANLAQLMLDIVRQRQKPWQAMLEGEQRAVSDSIVLACHEAARKIFRLSLALNHTVAPAKICKVSADEKTVELKVRISTTDNPIVHALYDLIGGLVPMVLTNWQGYIGEMAKYHLLADQQPLPLGDPRAPPDAAAEAKVDKDLEEIIDQDTGEIIKRPDESEKPVAFVSDMSVEREAARRDPYAAGRSAADRGENETRNPFPHPSIDSAEWLRGLAEREQEIAAVAAVRSGKRQRRRANGPEQSVDQ
jgi:hypothetical protein